VLEGTQTQQIETWEEEEEEEEEEEKKEEKKKKKKKKKKKASYGEHGTPLQTHTLLSHTVSAAACWQTRRRDLTALPTTAAQPYFRKQKR